MRVEAVLGPRVRVRDVQRAGWVVVMVPGDFPVVADVRVTQVQQGRGQHAMLVCPRCHRGRRELFAVDRSLACRTCARVRTRHQTEKGRASWVRAGNRLEDELMRVAARARGRPERLERVRRVAALLGRLDDERAGAAIRLANDALGDVMKGSAD